MKSTVLWALILLNAVLLMSFLARVTHQNSAMAQPAGRGNAPATPPARPGDYAMIPAEVNGASNGIVVIVDQTNGLLSAISYDDANKRMDTMAKIDLQQVFQRGAASGRHGK